MILIIKKLIRRIKKVWSRLGSGLVTGASDDDPSGIATFTQAGAGFGYSMLWMALFTFPLTASVQGMCARIGLATEEGLIGAIKKYYPKVLMYFVMVISFPALTINIGADIQAMGAVANLLVPQVPSFVFSILFVIVLIFVIIKFPYQKLVDTMKWLCLSFMLYFIVPFFVSADWMGVLRGTFIPVIELDKSYLQILVAILGATVSPYLFFWQTSMVAEDVEHNPRKLIINNRVILAHLKRDVDVGRIFANLVMFFIIFTSGAVLFTSGVRDIATVGEAAEALKPIAGHFAYLFFALGILSTGFLAIPVLGGSLSYILSECFNWRQGFDKRFTQAPGFYITLIISLIIGLCLDFLGIDPVQTLIYSAVLYGLIAPILIAIILHMSNNKKIMGELTNSKKANFFGFSTLVLMTLAGGALIYFQLKE